MKKTLFCIGLTISFSAVSAETLYIPTDSKATYTILEKSKHGNNATITTKRISPSGTTYCKRLYNCSAWTVKYLGDGETMAQMKKSEADERMSSIVQDSIADNLGLKAYR